MRFFIVPALFVAAVVAGPIFQPRSENEVERVERDLPFDSSSIAELELRDLDLSELFKRAKQSGGRGLSGDSHVYYASRSAELRSLDKEPKTQSPQESSEFRTRMHLI
ncbi:hypothetical protein C8J56DRAFT_1172782 [Mycena floridula]|nr:hypothetical protein C8J56DRAFT_1172782 [Mycena floridula]